ncbi:hypothetical protein IAT38_000945 [Cryptococcus sp. DSM 104549]
MPVNSDAPRNRQSSEQYELPLYRLPSSSTAPSLPRSPPKTDPFSHPDSLRPLFPVHHLILQHLADLAPLKALTLSRYTYDILTPYIYRHVTASKNLLRGLELAEGYERKLKALKCAKTLSLEDKAGVWHVAMLGHASNEPRVYEGVFSGVKVVETSLEVREGGYHEHVAAITRRLGYKEMLERIEPQLGAGWVEKAKEGEEWWDGESMHFTIEGDAPPAAPGLTFVIPVPPPPGPFQRWLKAAIPTFFGALITIAPVIFFVFASLATEPIHNLAITTLTANWVVDIRPEGNITVPVKINVGVACGCIWYNDTGPSCNWAIPWRPDPNLLHLPANQTLTKTFPTANGGALIAVHALAAASIVSVVFAYTDQSTTSKGFTKVGSMFGASWVVFGISIAYDTGIKNNIAKDDAGMGYKHHTGSAVWLSLVGAIFQLFWLTATGPSSS